MTKINWKLRLKNKATLAALCVIALTVVYQMLGWCGITPGVTQDAVQNVIELIVKALVLLGVVVDPTTEGAGDSTQALGYDYPAQTAPTAAAEEIKNTEEGDA
jgi:phi LC3 family holin